MNPDDPQTQNSNSPQQPQTSNSLPVVVVSPQVQVASPEIDSVQPENSSVSQPVPLQPQVVQPNIAQPLVDTPIITSPQVQPPAPVLPNPATPEPAVSNLPVQPTVTSSSPEKVITQVPQAQSPVQTPVSNIGMQSSIPATPQDKKTPLVTLAAQLTFGGTDDKKPKTLVGKIIGVVVMIIAVAATAGSMYGARHVQAARHEIHQISNPYAAKRDDDKKKAIKESGPETQDGKDGKVDVSKLFSADIAQHPQDITAKYDKQINLANGLSFMVTGSERGWDTKDQYTQPAKGKQFVKIALSTGYRGKTGTKYISTYEFKLKNSKGGLQDARTIGGEILPNNDLEISSGSLNPGDKREGFVVYEIDKDEAVTLVFESKGYDDKGSDFVMRGSVDIKK